MTPDDQANVARLRKLQRRTNATLNAIAWRISDISAVRPSAAQWAVLWPSLEATAVTLQDLADQLAAAHTIARAQRRQLLDLTIDGADGAEAP